MAQSLVLDKALNHKKTIELDLKSKFEIGTILDIDDLDPSYRGPENITFNYKLLKHLVTKPEKTQAECRLLIDQLRFFNFPRLAKESIPEFSEEKLYELAKLLKVERHPSNVPLYSEGEYCNARMFLILSGEVTLTQRKEDPVTKMILSARPPAIITKKGDKNHFLPHSPKKKPNPKEVLKFHESLLRSNSLKKVQFDILKLKTNDNKGGLEALENNPGASLSPGKYDIEIPSCESLSDEGYSPKTKKMLSMKKISLQGRNTDHYNVIRKLPGEYFGEEIITGHPKRKFTAFVSAPSELIIVKVEDIRHVENIFENKIIDVYNFIKEVVPYAERLGYPDVKRNIIPYLMEKRYDKGANVCEEGGESNLFFILKEGECQCFKKYVTDLEKHQKVEHGLEDLFQVEKKVEQVSLYNLNRPCLIAEEILFNEDGKYESSVKIVSQFAVFYAIDKTKYFEHFPEEVIKGMKKLAKNKKMSNKRLIKEKFHLLEETFPKKIILSELTTQGSEPFLSPRYPQQPRIRKITPRISTNNDNIVEIQAYHSPQAHPYLNALNPEILTISEKFKEFSHTKWHRGTHSMQNSMVLPKSVTAQLIEEYQASTETKETKETEFKKDSEAKTTTVNEENDAKVMDSVRRNYKETLEREKFFGTDKKSKHYRSYSNNIALQTLTSPRTEAPPQTVHTPKVSKQLSLIQSQTEKLVANPKILSTFFNRKIEESPFAQTVKIFPKPNPMSQLKNYLLDPRIPTKKNNSSTQRGDNNTLSINNSQSGMMKTNSFTHSARKLNSNPKRALRLNVIQGVFY